MLSGFKSAMTESTRSRELGLVVGQARTCVNNVTLSVKVIEPGE